MHQPNELNYSSRPGSNNRVVLFLVLALAVLFMVALVAVFFIWRLTTPAPLLKAYETCDGPHAVEYILGESSELTDSGRKELEESGDFSVLSEFLDGRLELEDSDTTLVINTLPEDDDALGLSAVAIECVLTHMGAPSWLETDMASTRALDGKQSAEWEGFQFQWRYHPNSGMNLIIRHAD